MQQTELDWDTLVAERNAWIAHNFPDHKLKPPGESILGCIEEVGELAHAHLKELQSIRGSSTKHQADAQDAIGDLTVYLLGVINAARQTPASLANAAPSCGTSAEALLALSGAVGSLSRSYLRKWGLIRAIHLIPHYAAQYCLLREWDYGAIVMETWNGVKQRDWIAYPDTGLPPVEAYGTNDHLTPADKAVGADGK